MKSILLATASILAFAGAAAADHVNEETPEGVSLGGNGTFGYNDTIEDGFFSEGDLGFVLATELNNNLLIAVTFGIGFEDDDENDFGEDNFSVGDDFVLSLTDRGGVNGFHFGSTRFAAETHWDDVGEMASDGFSEQTDETVLRGDGAFGGFAGSVSYLIADSDGDTPDVSGAGDDVDQLSVGASGAFGNFNVAAGYQEESDILERAPTDDDPNTDTDEFNEDNSEDDVFDSDSDDDFTADEIAAIRVGTTFAGADLAIGYARNFGVGDNAVETESLGVEAAYPFGPVTLGAYYVFEDSDAGDVDDSWGVSAAYDSERFDVVVFHEVELGEDETGFEATADLGGGLSTNFGASTEDDNFVAALYDLGSGATAFASWAEIDEAGEADYKEGTTVGISFEF